MVARAVAIHPSGHVAAVGTGQQVNVRLGEHGLDTLALADGQRRGVAAGKASAAVPQPG